MNLFKCSPCKKSFSGKSQLVRHLATHSGAKPYKCEHCENNFTRSDYLKAHIKAHHTGDIQFKCEFCGKCCTSNYQLQQHTNIHTGVKPYKCSLCNKSYRYKPQLLDHQNRHAGIRPWKCKIPHCDKSFVCESELKTHLNYHSGVKPYECNQCQKKFTQHCHWRAHLRTHTGDKPFKCDLCSRAFSQSSHLQTHKSFHTGVKPYECSVCKEKFRLPHTLKSHMRTHTGERPYKCHLCPMTFTQCSPLNHHIEKIHGVARTYPCPTCGKEFPTRIQTRVHQKTHSQVKQFFCIFCDKGWVRKHDLFKHIRSHTQEKPFVCSKCGVSYGSSHNEKACARGSRPVPPPLQSSTLGLPEKTQVESTTLEEKVLKYYDDNTSSSSVQPEVLYQEPTSTSLSIQPSSPTGSSENQIQKKKMDIAPPKIVEANPLALKLLQCKICKVVMKHQNQLNGHMNVHKKRKKYKLITSRRKSSTSQKLPVPPPVLLSSLAPAALAPSSQNEKKNVEHLSKQKMELNPVVTLNMGMVNNKNTSSQKKKVKELTSAAFKIFQCPICNQHMKHQNQLNGHMNIHKEKEKTMKKRKRATNSRRRRKQKKVAPINGLVNKDPLLDPDLLDDSDLEIEYATAEDNDDYPIPSPKPIPINIEDILLANDSADAHFRPPSPEQSELRIESVHSVRHVPAAELNNMTNFRPFQCTFCNKMYKTERELERHMEIHDDVKMVAKKLKPILAKEIPQLAVVAKPVQNKTETVASSRHSEKSEIKKKTTSTPAPAAPKVVNTEKKDADNVKSYLLPAPPEILEIFDEDDDDTVCIMGDFSKSEMPKLKNNNAYTDDDPPTRHQKRKSHSSGDSSSPPILVDETKINSEQRQLDEDHNNAPPRSKEEEMMLPQKRMSRLVNEMKSLHNEKSLIIDISPPPPPSAKKKKSIRCSLCRRLFGNPGALAVHMKTHSKSQIPPQPVVELQQLQQQKQSVIEQKSPRVDQFINASPLQIEQPRQQQQKLLEKKYKCILCSFVTTVSSELTLHAQAVHYFNSKKY